MEKREIEKKINNLLSEKLFSGIRKIYTRDRIESFKKSSEYTRAKDDEKKVLLNAKYKELFDSISSFFLTYKSIYALVPIVEAETKIEEFMSEEIFRVRVDYNYKGDDFKAFYPTRFKANMEKEINDCVSYLKNEKYTQKKEAIKNFLLSL